MFNFIKKFFGKSEGKGTGKQKVSSRSKDSIDSYYEAEIKLSPYLKEDSFGLVMSHLRNEVNILKTPNKLSAEEKKALNLNTRLSITQELISVLNEQGLKLSNPKLAIQKIYYQATFNHSKDTTLNQLRGSGIKKFKLSAPNDERTCSWCKAQSGLDLPVDTDVNELIRQNCSCEGWNRMVVIASIK